MEQAKKLSADPNSQDGRPVRALTADLYRVISNEAGCRKDFSYASWSNRAHFFAGARLRLFLELLFIFVHPKLLSLLRSSTWCCPPVISSITMDHDESVQITMAED